MNKGLKEDLQALRFYRKSWDDLFAKHEKSAASDSAMHPHEKSAKLARQEKSRDVSRDRLTHKTIL